MFECSPYGAMVKKRKRNPLNGVMLNENEKKSFNLKTQTFSNILEILWMGGFLSNLGLMRTAASEKPGSTDDRLIENT